MKASILGCLSAILISNAVHADIRIETVNANQQPMIFTGNDRYARMDTPGQNRYALIDVQRQQFYLVNPQAREALQMSAPKKRPSQVAGAPKIQLENIGNGPDIAGYATRKFRLNANGMPCATIYGSSTAARLPGMQKLFDQLARLQQRINQMMSGLRLNTDACTLAKSATAETFRTTGLPLRIDNTRGQTQMQVRRIDRNVKIAQDQYQLPADFKIISMQQQMQQMQDQQSRMLQQMQQQMPEMGKMIEQLRQNGEMPESARQKLQELKNLYMQRTPQ